MRKKMTTLFAVNLFIASISQGVDALASTSVAVLQDSFATVAARSKPAVVNISVVQEQRAQAQTPHFFFGDPEEFFHAPRQRTYRYRTRGNGSGFIIDPQGHCVTNDHVIRNATEIRVTMTRPDGKEKTYPAKVVARDPALDLAVVQIQAKETFPHLRLAEALPRVGDWAIAIGSPFALERTVTVGVVSAVRQSLVIEGRRYPNMLQTDAAINQGNSGGPLLNLQGEVMGVNTAIFSPSGASAGIGFAIPSAEVRTAIEYLVAGKRLKRGWLGVETAPVDEVVRRRFALPSAEGALVNSVFAGSPAERAGLKRGDVIRAANGRPVASPQDLINEVSRVEAGKPVEFRVHRAGRPLELKATLGERPDWADVQGGRPGPRGTPEEEEIPSGLRGQAFAWEGVSFAQEQGAVVVAQVQGDSTLLGYLMQGDVVRGVNERQVRGLDDLKAALQRAKLSDGLFLDILRQGQPLYISVRP